MSEALEFLDELIVNQVLTSELEPAVTVTDALGRIISILRRIGKLKDTTEKLGEIN